MTSEPLAGRTVVVTRQQPGELARRLAGLGADVVHLPLIEIVDPADGGVALRGALSRAGDYRWLVVTSPNGARYVAAAARDVGLVGWPQLAVVGTATAAAMRDLTGRDADLVASVQTLDGLVSEFPVGAGRVLAVRGNLADPSLGPSLAELGWSMDDVVAYRTVSRTPAEPDRARAAAADVITFASGSAVQAWVEGFGPKFATATDDFGPAVVTIGPATTAVATSVGVHVDVVAEPHSLDGLVAATVTACARRPR